MLTFFIADIKKTKASTNHFAGLTAHNYKEAELTIAWFK